LVEPIHDHVHAASLDDVSSTEAKEDGIIKPT
jgi:hypothetical protein